MSGEGRTLREQLLSAVTRAARDPRFSGSIVRADLDQVSIEVWLQTSSELIPMEEREGERAIELGMDGVDVAMNKASAYYKPSVALTSRFESAAAMFSALCKKAHLPENAWKSDECSLRKSSWIHLCEAPGQEALLMTALRPQTPLALTATAMADWAHRCVDYFVQNQYADGSFCYQYLPFTNTAKKGIANPVRESGCAYAMAEAASSPHLPDDCKIMECAERAIAATLIRMVQQEDGSGYIADRLKQPLGGKLGTTALLLLALLTPRMRDAYRQEIEILLKGILSSQLDSGLFACTFGEAQEGDSQVNFFPGQAILALIVKASLGDESCRDAYRLAFGPYREHFRRSPATAFVGWHADVWCRASMLDQNSEYAEFVFEQLDWLLPMQLRGKQHGVYAGGFSNNGKPPHYSSIVYTEAIARGADLAYRTGDRRWLQYRDAFRAGLEFCSRLRLTGEQSIFFPHPSRAIGGMATSISDFSVRSDVVQHALTLTLAILERPLLYAM
jgi:hypothetical protein